MGFRRAIHRSSRKPLERENSQETSAKEQLVARIDRRDQFAMDVSSLPTDIDCGFAAPAEAKIQAFAA